MLYMFQYSAPEDMNGRLNQLVLHDKHNHHHNRNDRGNFHGHGYAPANHVPAILHNLSGQGGRALYSSQHHIMVPATRIGGQPTSWKAHQTSVGPSVGPNTHIVYDKGNVSLPLPIRHCNNLIVEMTYEALNDGDNEIIITRLSINMYM